MPAIASAPGRRTATVLAAGLLVAPFLAGCGGEEDPSEGKSGSARDLSVAEREQVRFGGTLRWAVDAAPVTLNAYQDDADAATDRIAAATLPALFTLDSRGRPQLNTDYLESAEVTEREPQQVVVYRLNPKARWSDGTPLSAADFAAQWHALGGGDGGYWAARAAGYDRIHKVEPGKEEGRVRVTFARPYADWRSLFTPLYPRSVTGEPKAFNTTSRTKLPVSAGPFAVKGGTLDPTSDSVTLERNTAWWGERAKLDSLVLKAVPPAERGDALAAGELDVAEIRQPVADRIAKAARPRTAGAQEHGTASDDAKAAEEDEKDEKDAAEEEQEAEKDGSGGADEKKEAGEKAEAAKERERLRRYTVRRAYAPSYVQLALNGTSGPLRDERVRRAVAQALDREALARAVHRPAGLPVRALGSHLRMYDQAGYHDNSAAVGEATTASASGLLAEAGWKGGPAVPSTGDGTDAAGAATAGQADADAAKNGTGDGDARRAGAARPVRAPAFTGVASSSERGRAAVLRQAAHADARAAKAAKKKGGKNAKKLAEAAEASLAAATEASDALDTLLHAEANLLRLKEGRELELRMVLPAGDGSEQIRRTGERIVAMLQRVGVGVEVTRVPDGAFFQDHLASGDFDLALYGWPATAYPATDTRSIFAKPVASPDGSLLIEQNFTRVGTDQVDQLFEQAVTELDDEEREELIRRIDARVWAAAGSVPLFQPPQLVAVARSLGNAGAFGLETPRYQDIGHARPARAQEGASAAPARSGQ
nr:ABC transporter family substrate-binding protein [Streptomyces chumphonensis]